MVRKTYIVTVDEKSSFTGSMPMPAYGSSRYDKVTITRPVSVAALDGNPKLYTSEVLEKERQAGEQAGQNEAWDLARKIVEPENDGGYDISELRDIFGYGPAVTLKKYSFHEAAALVQKWEEKIRVGDVVRLRYGGKDDQLAVVTYVMPDLLTILLASGNTSTVDKGRCTKLGKKLNIESLLVELDGEEE